MKLADKPSISFTDLSPLVVMEELGIGKIINADSHFQQVGKSFQIVRSWSSTEDERLCLKGRR